jgi:hypothetical protein
MGRVNRDIKLKRRSSGSDREPFVLLCFLKNVSHAYVWFLLAGADLCINRTRFGAVDWTGTEALRRWAVNGIDTIVEERP